MKYIYTTIFGLMSALVLAQIGIGVTAPHQKAILDFGTDADKGIVLPHTNNLDVASSSEGTLYYDANQSKVMLVENAGATKDLSVNKVETANAFKVNDAEYLKYKENMNTYGAVIGEDPALVAGIPQGVMVLETTDKALALPVTDDFNKLKTPAPGTLVYDTTIDKICVFDGEKWAFWGK